VSALLLGALLAPALAGEIFVSAADAESLRGLGATFIDARGGDWSEGHIPGSAPLDWLSLRDGLLKTGRLDDADDLGAAVRAAGVTGGTVVVYGAGRDGWGEGGRIYWMLDYLGHPDVRLLDGGWPAWTAAGLPVSKSDDAPPPGDFQPKPQEDERALLAEVEAARAGGAVLWDTREAREYAGETPYGEAHGGHIPEAVHLWYADLTRPDGTLKPEAELRGLLAGAGVPLDRPVIALCTGGVRSGFAYAVLKELGHPSPSNYDGSMWEWTAADRPVKEGP